MTVFKYYIVCNFNYCPLICHYCGCINARKQEKIQYRALKFVYNSDDSYETLLQRADLPSINLARIRKIAIEDFKILNQTSPDVLNEMISFRENRRAIIPPPPPRRTPRFGLLSFTYDGAKIWNALPNDLRVYVKTIPSSKNYYSHGLVPPSTVQYVSS